jgi:hypothetical protein
MRVSGFRAGAVRTLVYITLLVPQGACGAGWHRITPPAPTTLPSRQQVEVWQGGRLLRLHAIRLTNDSLSGVPFVKPPMKDSFWSMRRRDRWTAVRRSASRRAVRKESRLD